MPREGKNRMEARPCRTQGRDGFFGGGYARRVFALISLLSLPTTPAFAITEAQFLQKVLAQDKLLEEAQIGLDIKQIELETSRDGYKNWKAELSIDLDYQYRGLERDSVSKSTYTGQSQNYPREISLDLEKRFLSHPGSLKLGISRDQDKTSFERYKQGVHVPASDYQTEGYQTTHYIRFSYPLLKRDSNASSLRTYHKDILDLKRQKLSFYETKEDFLRDRLNDYLSWILYQRQDLIDREFLDKLQQLNPADEAESTLLKSTISQIEKYNSDTRAKLQGIREKLSILLDDRGILTETPEFDLLKRAELVTQDMSAYLRARNRELERINLNILLRQIDIDYYENQRLPELDLMLEAKQTQLDKRHNTSKTPQVQDDLTDYSIGLEFSYPLGGSISNRANLAKSRLGVRRLEIGYAEKLQDLLADIRLLDTLLTLDEERLLEAIETAEQSTRIERQNYQSGATSFRDLLQSYRDERTARLDYIDTIIDYQKNRIKYDNLLDRIIMTPCPASRSLSECEL